MPARRPRRRREQSAPLVVAQRLDVHPGTFRDLADSHAVTIDPYPGTEIKPSLAAGDPPAAGGRGPYGRLRILRHRVAAKDTLARGEGAATVAACRPRCSSPIERRRRAASSSGT